MERRNVFIFDPGTSDPATLSVKPPLEHLAVVTGPPHDLNPAQLPSNSQSKLAPAGMLPKHRTWSGGVLFTLPEGSMVSATGNR
jgi:hypothetical protein